MKNLVFLLMLCAGSTFAAEKPVYKWNAGNDLYLILPMPQRLEVKALGASEVVHPAGVGVRSVGNGERFSPGGGVQFQVGRNAHDQQFWLLDVLGGLQYLSPLARGPWRATGAALGGLGVSDNTLYFAQQLEFGLLYVTDPEAETPTGFSLSLYWRPMDVLLHNAGVGGPVVLRPGVGLRLGYVFSGFWSVK